MAVFNNSVNTSPIETAEFTPVPEGNTTFFRLKEGADAGAVKQWLTKDLGQNIEAETALGKQTVLVTRGDKNQKELTEGLKEHGVSLTPPPEPPKKVNLWKARGMLSMIGHPMQLVSGAMAKGGMDTATVGFATLNLMANLTNFIFGAEKKTAPNHLRYIKTEVNKLVTPYVPAGTELPDPSDKRASLRKEPDAPKSPWQKFSGFMQRHSVMFGEIGLRYAGGLVLIFSAVKLKKVEGGINGETKQSVEHWAQAARALYKNEIETVTKDTITNPGLGTRVKAAWDFVKNPDSFTRIAGTGWIMGKNIAFLSKVPDEYDPNKPDPNSTKGKIDKLRGGATFKISTVTEAMGASIMAYDRLFRRTITIPEKVTLKEALVKTGVDAHGEETFVAHHIKHKSGFWWNIFPEKIPDSRFVPKEIPAWKKYEGALLHEGNETGEKMLLKNSQMPIFGSVAKIPIMRFDKAKQLDLKVGEYLVKVDLPFMERLARVVSGNNVPGMKIRGAKLRGVPIPDIIGGVGATLFAAAFVMRFNAPFGTREVNMDEVDAHVADSLAKVPPAKLPQAVAETAAFLTDHFKDKKLNYGEVYNKLVSDLYDDHNIALPGADGGMGTPKPPGHEQERKTFANAGLRKHGHIPAHRGEHFRDRITPVMESESLGL